MPSNEPLTVFLIQHRPSHVRSELSRRKALENWIYLVINWFELAVLLPDARELWSRVALQIRLCGGGVQ